MFHEGSSRRTERDKVDYIKPDSSSLSRVDEALRSFTSKSEHALFERS